MVTLVGEGKKGISCPQIVRPPSLSRPQTSVHSEFIEGSTQSYSIELFKRESVAMLFSWFSIRNLQQFLAGKENRAIHHCPATEAEGDKLQQRGFAKELETRFNCESWQISCLCLPCRISSLILYGKTTIWKGSFPVILFTHTRILAQETYYGRCLLC